MLTTTNPLSSKTSPIPLLGLVPSPRRAMHTRTSQELQTLFELGLGCEATALAAHNVPDMAILVPGGRWLLVPTNANDQEGQGRLCYFDLSVSPDDHEATKPRTLCTSQYFDLPTMSFSGIQLETGSPTLNFTFVQVYRVSDDSEAPADSPWLLHVWRVQEISDALHAECVRTMRLGSLEDAEARVALYPGSLHDKNLAFSINMESDDFSVVMVANWEDVGDDEEGYEGKIFPRIGARQQFESMTLLPDSQLLLTSTTGQVSIIQYTSLNTSTYPEYDGSLMSDAEVIQTPLSTSTDSKERISARSANTTLPTTTFQSHAMPAQRAIQCQ